MQAGYTLSKEKYQKDQIWILVRKKLDLSLDKEENDTCVPSKGK